MRRGSYRASSSYRGPAAGSRGPSRAPHTSGTRRADPFPILCPLLPQLSPRVGSEGTVGPRGLCACPEESFPLHGRLEGSWRRERRICRLEVRRGNDTRTAFGSERVPRVHFHLEQAERPSGAVRLRARELARAEWVDLSQCMGKSLKDQGGGACRARGWAGGVSLGR